MTTRNETRSFGLLLQRHRLAAGLSQEELAERAGLSRRGITDLERGARRSPYPSTVRRLAEALCLVEHDRADFVAASRPPAATAASDLTPALPPVAVSAQGERKQATVLCCQFIDSARLSRELGQAALLDLLEHLIQEASDEVAKYEGSVAAVLGDGIVAVFGMPLAQEDHARRALLSAVGIQRRLNRPLGPEVRRRTAPAFRLGERVRMGLHTGWLAFTQVGATDQERTAAIGEATAVASAIQQGLEPGSIAISGATARLVAGLARLEELDTGGGARTPVYRLIGLMPRHSRLDGRDARRLSPFVGRGREMSTLSGALSEIGRSTDLALLQRLWTRGQSGHGQVIGIVGEPGMGKSRLVYEFCRNLSDTRVTYLEGRCLSYASSTPYLPIADLVRVNCGIQDADEPDGIEQKVRSRLVEVGLDPDEHAPYVLHMLGQAESAWDVRALGPEVVRARTFDTLRRWLLAASYKRPVIVVVEDLQWIDRTSEEYLTLLVDGLEGAPVLLLVTWRPGYHPPWIEHSYVTQLALRPLELHDCLAVMGSIVAPAVLPAALAHGILERADGNPFFLEELARALTEHPASVDTDALPDAVQGVLAARIDRLEAGPRTVLQIASTIGRDFPLPMLRAVCDEPIDIALALQQLQRMEFVHEQPGDHDAFTFKHALTQEAAYASLAASRRRRLHQRIGSALLELMPEIVDIQPELLAHHLTEAGMDEAAIGYWQMAGERAVERSANVEAISHFRKAIDLLSNLPDTTERAHREVSLQIALGSPLIALHGYGAPETVSAYTRARELAEQVNDPELLFPLLFRQWAMHSIRSEQRAARAAADEFLSLAELQADSAPRMIAHRLLGVSLHLMGAFAASQREFATALALYDPNQHPQLAFRYGQETRAAILAWAAVGVWLMGSVAEADRMLRTAISFAAESRHVNTQGFVLVFGGCILESLRGDAAAIQPHLQALVGLADEYHLAMWRAYATTFDGWMIGARGDPLRGIARMRVGLSDLRSSGTEGLRPHLLGLLGSTYLGAGQTEPAHEALAEAFDLVNRGGEHWCEAELYCLEGELLRRRQGQDDAEAAACFERALAIAESQGADSLVSRVRKSMQSSRAGKS